MIYSFLTSSTQFIVELKQCSIVDKNQVLIPDAGTDHKGLPSCRQAKEVSFLPFCNCLTNKSLSTFANIWFDVKIAVVLLIMLTFNPLFQSRKWKQVETSQPKFCSKSGAALGLKVKKILTLSYSDRQKVILFGYHLSLVISCRYCWSTFFFCFPFLHRIVIKEMKIVEQ